MGSSEFKLGERVRVRETPRTIDAGSAGAVGVISGSGRSWWSRRVSEYVIHVAPDDAGSEYFGVRPDEIERLD